MSAARGAALTAASSDRPPRVLRLLGAVGDAFIGPTVGLWRVLGLGAATILHGVRPGSWRRTVRDEFVRHCHEVGLAALPAVAVVGLLAGLGLVLQALYWLGLFGQSDVVGRLLVLVLVRELAPVLVGLLVIGRSVTMHVTELHALAESGRLATLDAMGIDPFHLLVLPRVLAVALCCFCLNVLFLGTALVSGYVGASVAELTSLAFGSFLDDVLDNMDVGDFALTAAKPLLIGFTVALIACSVSLWPGRETQPLRQLLPRVFVAAMSAVLLISGVLSALL